MNGNGRFQAGLLWKKETEEMPNSYCSAERRLRNIERKVDKGKSLNDEFQTGPDLQSSFEVLLRFRQGPHAVAADIKEMSLEIIIREADRDSLKFLWRGKSRDTSPTEYRMTSLVLGAPLTAIYVKNNNTEDYKHKYPDAAELLKGITI